MWQISVKDKVHDMNKSLILEEAVRQEQHNSKKDATIVAYQ